MLRAAALAPFLLVMGCNPPAAEDYVARVGVIERDAPSPPIVSPDTQGAIWAPSAPRRLVYGKPGQQVLFALACNGGGAAPMLTFTRFAAADAHAKAVLALIGNGHVARLKIDAVQDGKAWRWRGSARADDPAFDALTGGRQIEATVPGAGSLILNPSPQLADLVLACRAQAVPANRVPALGAADAPPPSLPGTIDTTAPPPPLAR